MLSQVGAIVRNTLGSFTFTKRLPKEFGSINVYVTPRSDMRVVYPGFDRSAGDLMAVCRNFIKINDVVWDIGSNLGIFSACAAAKSGPSGFVYAVEADPTYAALQHRTFSKFPSTAAKTAVLCAAAADRIDLLDFTVSAKGHARSGLSSVVDTPVQDIKQVIAVTLDFLSDHWQPPNFVKIDVEGADFLVLQGAQRVLRQHRPILYTEMTESTYEPSSKFLLDFGYQIYRLNEEGSTSSLDGFSPYVIAKPA